jgi:acetyltransferase-like isoleucine patch superfamily enzyme
VHAQWVRGEGPDTEQRRRLVDAGVPESELEQLRVRELSGAFPAWWHDQGNALFLADGVATPDGMIEGILAGPVRNALVVLASSVDAMAYCLPRGDRPTVYIGPECSLPRAELHCADASSVVLVRKVTSTFASVIDARNGGSIVAGADQLWATGTSVTTDDMHRLEDAATGARLNPFGAHIRLGEHVWLGRDVVVTGDVEIGANSVVGARSLVRGKSFPPNSAIAGTPARVVREGVMWQREDTP